MQRTKWRLNLAARRRRAARHRRNARLHPGIATPLPPEPGGDKAGTADTIGTTITLVIPPLGAPVAPARTARPT